VEDLVRLDGLQVGIIRETPRPEVLFGGHVDLAVVSDSLSSPSFVRLFGPGADAGGFLNRRQVERVCRCYAHHARNPIRLFHVPRRERTSARVITERCSLLSLGAMDRRYAHKYVLFVPSLAHADERLLQANSEDYVEAAMYVAGFTKSRSIYFAGFGGLDGSFPNEMLVRLTARTYVARRALHLEPLHVYFKYSTAASEMCLRYVGVQLALLEENPVCGSGLGDAEVRAA